ncbi:DNA repair protein RecO [Shewanella xiamenensis]|uniref:DNA repair protein RecO n=1 Tax=Shewanella xiamenensis TaxID=332186 RepID=A0ABT6U6J6_9GAMM|nr:DNA repair protein RecO [Shewanella xiamenensis]MBW0294922.1 DNA repair protein RecO [Shewanella xiamenensis]MDI5830075.1 DNA repair protein RecO [Shewanella xiamenensis]
MKRGYVLHHRPYRESSALVNLLVDGIGRVDAVARVGSGKRSIKSILQPFQPLIFEFSGKSELKNISQIEAAAPAVPLSGYSLYAGMYINELLMRTLSVHHNAEALFLIYHQALVGLAAQFCESKLRYLELALLRELGAMPSLIRDTQGEPLIPEHYYQLVPELGFQFVLNSRAKHTYQGAMLTALNDNQLLQEQFLAAKRLMRSMLQPLLGDKPLVSRQLFMQATAPKMNGNN